MYLCMRVCGGLYKWHCFSIQVHSKKTGAEGSVCFYERHCYAFVQMTTIECNIDVTAATSMWPIGPYSRFVYFIILKEMHHSRKMTILSQLLSKEVIIDNKAETKLGLFRVQWVPVTTFSFCNKTININILHTLNP